MAWILNDSEKVAPIWGGVMISLFLEQTCRIILGVNVSDGGSGLISSWFIVLDIIGPLQSHFDGQLF